MTRGAQAAEGDRSARLGLKELIAMGVGGMVGGGIFSVLGIAVGESGHAAPIAFALGGGVALLTGRSYGHLGLAFRGDGGSFTYLEHAFPHTAVAGLAGWLLLAGYVGTLGLYAFTFGAYGSAMLGAEGHEVAARQVLASFALLVFLSVNLWGVRAAGTSEDLIVVVKMVILMLFAAAGLTSVRVDHLLPVFDHGALGVISGAALIFVAYEGFELIPNAVDEAEDAGRDLPRAITLAILITMTIYVLVALVAVGNLRPDEIAQAQEYALAQAAKPFLGQTGFLLIGLGALLSTSSAINATLFGTARLAQEMAREHALPRAFCLKPRGQDVPVVSLLLISGVTLVFVNTADLTVIASFASSTFLLIFTAVNLAAVRLRGRIGIGMAGPLAGALLALLSWGVLCSYLWQHDRESLRWMGGAYAAVAFGELVFSRRRLFAPRRG